QLTGRAPARSANDALSVFVVQSNLEGHLDNPLEVIRNSMRDRFNFQVITSDQLGKTTDYRKNLQEAIQGSIFVVAVLDSLTPSLAFELGLAVSVGKPLIVLKSHNAEIDVRGLYSDKELKNDSVQKAPQPKLNYLAHLPGLIEEQVIVFQPGDAEGLITRLVREIVLNREAIATEILRTGRDVPLNLYLQFLSYLDGEERKRILGEAMERFPTDKSLFIMAGKIKLMENDLVGAARDFERAVELNPEDPDAHMKKGEVFYELGQFDTAAKDYEKAIELQPVNPHAYYNKGNALFYMDSDDDASRNYTIAIEQKPDFANALNNQASIAITRGNFAKAIELLTRAIDRQPSYAFSYFNMARVYKAMGKPGGDVLKNLERAAKSAKGNLRMGHDIKRNTYCLFLVYAALGDREGALDYLRKCSNYDLPLKSWGIAEKITNDSLKNDPEFQALIATSR
ncbi:MAG: tetratricopeptide repeat protein, partial [bacterium]